MNKPKKREQQVKKWICLYGLLHEFTQLNKKSVRHFDLEDVFKNQFRQATNLVFNQEK